MGFRKKNAKTKGANKASADVLPGKPAKQLTKEDKKLLSARMAEIRHENGGKSTVQNHLTEQIGDDFQKLYPGANILVATKKDFQKANRQQLFAKIATGNYDAVIIVHSQLGKIPVSKERQVMTIQSQIDDILRGIEELKKSEGSKFQIKAMERTRKSLQKQLDKLQKSNQDDTLTFEQLGVDRLFLDEAQECTTRS